MLTEEQRRFLEVQRVAHLATADSVGHPHVVPICFAAGPDALYFVIDQKPKRVSALRLKRLRNLAENPRAAVVVDRYAEDWSRLAYVLVQGTTRILVPPDPEHGRGLALLRRRYPQYGAMELDLAPLVRIALERVIAWGDLV